MALHPTIKIGATLRYNDPRCEGRTVRVDKLAPEGVYGIIITSGQKVRIRARSIYCDSKARKTGFTLVQDEDKP